MPAALGSVLIAGLRFADLGRLKDQAWQLIALGSAAIAFVATGAVVWAASRVLRGRYVTFRQVYAEGGAAAQRTGAPPVEASPLIRAIESERRDLYGTTGASSLLQLHLGFNQVLDDPLSDGAVRSSWREATDRVTEFADAWETERRFETLIRVVMVCGTIIFLGVAAFAVALSRTDPGSLAKDTKVSVYFLGSGQSWAEKHLGCQVAMLDGVAVGGSLEHPVVIFAPAGTCRAGRVLVTAEIGFAVPK